MEDIEPLPLKKQRADSLAWAKNLWDGQTDTPKNGEDDISIFGTETKARNRMDSWSGSLIFGTANKNQSTFREEANSEPQEGTAAKEWWA